MGFFSSSGIFACYYLLVTFQCLLVGFLVSPSFLYFFYFGISLGIFWFSLDLPNLSCIPMGVFVSGFDVINAWDDIKSSFFLLVFLVCVSCLSLLWAFEFGMDTEVLPSCNAKRVHSPTGKTSVGRTLSFYTNNLTVETIS